MRPYAILTIIISLSKFAVGALTSDQSTCLKVHNAARAAVGVKALTWDPVSAAAATKLATYLTKQGCRRISANSSSTYGQNLALLGTGSTSTSTVLQAAARAFVDQAAYYKFALFNPPSASGCSKGYQACADYTQVVWNTSLTLGCGSSLCFPGYTLVVCNYFPRGNIVGRYPYINGKHFPPPPHSPPPPPKRKRPPPPPRRKSPPPPPAYAAVLSVHNAARSAVKVGGLAWNGSLARSAQTWADYLGKRKSCALSVDSATRVGQNVAGASFELTLAAAAQLWVDEKKKYTRALFNPPGASGCSTGNWADCGTYTQVVWNTTKTVGCAGYKCSSSSSVVVCDYYPRGNIIGRYPY
eukprot:TRINITY_DN5709_c0_g2_i1.p1 TRINITY_DN5709_c0_g2~~TRINITY_DN5709_c0_g2_i1.p1  ORF type:complete len:355 (-),score=22.08 TRINITY_DN5709_c0_g2_i1:1276-2340(-)